MHPQFTFLISTAYLGRSNTRGEMSSKKIFPTQTPSESEVERTEEFH